MSSSSAPKNVAFASGYSSGGTGIARYCRELVTSYCDFTCRNTTSGEVALVTPFNRGARPVGLPAAVAFHRSTLPGKVQKALNKVVPFEQIVSPLQTYDLIHSLCPEALNTALPWLVTVHDLAWRRYGTEYSKVFNSRMQRSAERSIAKASHLLAISRFTADELIAGGVEPNRISVIYQGILSNPDCNLEEATHSPLGAPPDLQELSIPERYFLYVGTSHPRKNLPLLARAYAMPGGKGLLPCLLAGPPVASDSDLGIDGTRLRHLGYLSDSLLSKVLTRATALVFPSLYEGFGRPLLEAMAGGIPAVASRIPAFIEVAQDAALFFDVEDKDSSARQLRDQLLELQNNSSLVEDLVCRGRHRARAFSWAKSSQQLSELYQHLI